jgi:hypothetical protein
MSQKSTIGLVIFFGLRNLAAAAVEIMRSSPLDQEDLGNSKAVGSPLHDIC